jgi:hypothetical protein
VGGHAAHQQRHESSTKRDSPPNHHHSPAPPRPRDTTLSRKSRRPPAKARTIDQTGFAPEPEPHLPTQTPRSCVRVLGGRSRRPPAKARILDQTRFAPEPPPLADAPHVLAIPHQTGDHAARQRRRESLAVVLQRIAVPFFVFPLAPAGEQKAPGVTAPATVVVFFLGLAFFLAADLGLAGFLLVVFGAAFLGCAAGVAGRSGAALCPVAGAGVAVALKSASAASELALGVGARAMLAGVDATGCAM